jgi:hypothetical protein
MATQELGKRFRRVPSMISRLYRDYEGKRDLERERKVVRALTVESRLRPDNHLAGFFSRP